MKHLTFNNEHLTIKSQMPNAKCKMSNGFTLVELLVVMGVLAIAGTLILVIFTNALKGNNKTQIVGIIKQNGQAVLETMDKTIRNADNVVCVGNSDKTLIVVQKGIYTRYKFVLPTLTPLANGFIKQDSPAKQDVEGSSPLREETDAEFVNRVCIINDPVDINPIVLTDTNLQTGVSIRGGSFTKNLNTGGFKDNITVEFQVAPAVGAPPSVAGEIDAVDFRTTVQLR